jgi:hypothetical protein
MFMNGTRKFLFSALYHIFFLVYHEVLNVCRPTFSVRSLELLKIKSIVFDLIFSFPAHFAGHWLVLRMGKVCSGSGWLTFRPDSTAKFKCCRGLLRSRDLFTITASLIQLNLFMKIRVYALSTHMKIIFFLS